MLARVRSATLCGVEAAAVSVEVDVTSGLPCFATVGLPDSTVRESRDRIRAAIRNAGFEFPIERITVHRAPADLRKEGAAFDLPMVLGILAATGLIKPDRLERVADPTATILSAALMLEPMGLCAEAQRRETAVGRVYRDGTALTPDPGGTAETREMAQAVLAAYQNA